MSIAEDDILWAIERLPLVENINVFRLTELESIAHTQTLQREVRALRALARAGIEELHQQTREIERQRRQIAQLRDQLRQQQQRDVAA